MGRETPAKAMVIAIRSKTEPRFSAEMTPVVTPATSQITAAPRASDAVTGSRRVISFQTGWLLLNEYPRHGAGQCSTSGAWE